MREQNTPTLSRRSTRLPEFDYTQSGAYFVTICVSQRRQLLGKIVDGTIQLSEAGLIATNVWEGINNKYEHVCADIYCVMPNHVHAIILIDEQGEVSSPLGNAIETGGETPPLRNPTLGQIVAFYKYETTKKINLLSGSAGTRFWQRNYFERVIRNEMEYEATSNYILANPSNWAQDEYNL